MTCVKQTSHDKIMTLLHSLIDFPSTDLINTYSSQLEPNCENTETHPISDSFDLLTGNHVRLTQRRCSQQSAGSIWLSYRT